MHIKNILAGILCLGLTNLTNAELNSPMKEEGKEMSENNVVLNTNEDKLGYSIGFTTGQDISKQAKDINMDKMLLGLQHGFSHTKPLLSVEQMEIILQGYGEKLRAEHEAKLKIQGGENLKIGEAFLSKNKTKEGVQTTDSGLQYKILKAGKGKTPTASDTVIVHYRGTLLDGTEFDSSYSRSKPATFGVDEVIPGWTEALQLMPVGSKYQLFIPANLAYGEYGVPNVIEQNSVLIFEVELIDITKQ